MPLPSYIEARVLELLDAVLQGKKIEDDLVECKAEWPRYDKVRQLAAHANRAHGESILWLVGVDETACKLIDQGPTDPEQWWATFSKRFDQATPRFEHQIVHHGSGRAVTALLFSTDQVPYVIKVGEESGKVEREIPIREGTRTRSAHRDEVLRMLRPAVQIPSGQLLSASLYVSRHASDLFEVTLNTQIFFEYLPMPGAARPMLPHHRVYVRLELLGRDGGKHTVDLTPDIRYSDDYIEHGLVSVKDGIFLSGPGVATVIGHRELTAEDWRLWPVDPQIGVKLAFAVANSSRFVNVDGELQRSRKLTYPNMPQTLQWDLEGRKQTDPWSAPES